jgi:uncharacterized RDD family membrane protein YckC
MKYHLARGEEQLGTFSDLDVSAGLRSGKFLPTDLCWTEGMAGWLPLKEHLQELNLPADPEGSLPPPVPTMRVEVHVREDLASRGQRLAARIIDWITILVPLVIMMSVVVDENMIKEIQAHPNDQKLLAEMLEKRFTYLQTAPDATVLASGWVVILVMTLNFIMLGLRGQSFGKLLIGIHVVRAVDGTRAGFLKAALLREVVFFLIGSIQYLGPVLSFGDALMIFRPDRRCLHDLVADTTVVVRRPR